MRRLLLVLILVFLLTTTVAAAGITQLQSDTVVEDNGKCHVTLDITLAPDTPVSGLKFPVPGQARNITVNGAKASMIKGENAVDISGAAAVGKLRLQYSLPDAVTSDDQGKLTLTLPLLSGFAYPIEHMEFTVHLPGAVEARPNFTSTYHQETAESVMTVTRDGNQIHGVVNERLQDQESITMTLAVTEKVFPQSFTKRFSLDTVDMIMILLSGVIVLYYFLFLFSKKEKRQRITTPPEGLNAGQTGLKLTGRGLDLPLMVLSWAQMGYILIQPDDNGRVLLHKRMDMGNERSELENRYFRSLFGSKKLIDGTGYHFARLSAKAAGSGSGRKLLYRRNSGSPRLLRLLAAILGVLGGVSHACAFSQDTAWRVVLSIFLGAVTAAASWLIQAGARSLYSRDKLPFYVSLASVGIWLLIALLCGEWIVWLFLVLAQYLVGFAAFYGGRRSETGNQTYSQLLDLRRYLKTVPTDELKKIQQYNPDYYYTLAPYALALGVGKAFARQMGNCKLPQCSYLTTGMDGHMTARDFYRLMESTVAAMDLLRQRMPIDKLLGK